MNTNEKKTNKTASPLAAGLTGVVLGAAGVAAVALSDEETRKKAKKKAFQIKDDLKKWSTKKVNELQKQKDSLKTAVHDKTEEKKSEVAKELKEHREQMEEEN